MRVRSLTFNSPAESSARIRRRVGSAAALSAATIALISKPPVVITELLTRKHIKISLCVKRHFAPATDLSGQSDPPPDRGGEGPPPPIGQYSCPSRCEAPEP